jgi:signal transduction histidine kinase
MFRSCPAARRLETMSTVAPSTGAAPMSATEGGRAHPPGPLVPADQAFLRFAAGIRALLASLTGAALLVMELPVPRAFGLLLVVPYLVWAAVLLWRTLEGWNQASRKAWLWIDAFVLMGISHSVVAGLPLFGLFTVLPVVALGVLAGVAHATALAAATTGLMVVGPRLWPNMPGVEPLPAQVALIVLLLGPAAAILARPSRELRQRQQLVEAVQSRADPRQGLGHHAEVLLDELAKHFRLTEALLSLRGPQPRVFGWHAGTGTVEFDEAESTDWGERLLLLPRDRGCRSSSSSGDVEGVVWTLHDPFTGRPVGVPDIAAQRTLERLSPHALALPLLNYGQSQGTLCLMRPDAPFDSGDLRWLHGVMGEVMPLLERCDLLEQLQRESAAGERERIGRDLHDSAIQPYLGLKYGLEALERRAGTDHALHPHVVQLVQLATDELQTLRDVVGGLRRGDDPTSQEEASLAALKRVAQRFSSLYGLRVDVSAPDAPRLRGSAAKAVLHMVSETLTNVRRHTSATTVNLTLQVTPTDVVLQVRNDHGFREQLTPAFLPRSLTERAAEFGGGVEVDHQTDFTEVRITLPVLGVLR